MDTPIVHVTPQLYQPLFETFSFEDELRRYPQSVDDHQIERQVCKLPNGQFAMNFRQSVCLKFDNGRYFNAAQYNITLSHRKGFSEDDFHILCERKDIIGKFFRSFTPLHARCINDPLHQTSAAIYRQNKLKTRFTFWKGLSDGIDIDDGRIKDPSAIEWSTYNFIWTRAKASDERLMMCGARFGNYESVGNPTIAPVSEAAFETFVNRGVMPTAPLELSLLDKDGCEDYCP